MEVATEDVVRRILDRYGRTRMVILDYVMPHMDGSQIAAIINRTLETLKGIDYRTLQKPRQKAYDDAKQFATQAAEPLRDRERKDVVRREQLADVLGRDREVVRAAAGELHRFAAGEVGFVVVELHGAVGGGQAAPQAVGESSVEQPATGRGDDGRAGWHEKQDRCGG